MLPEAVTIATTLCDLEWRRYIAMAETDLNLHQFYQLIARRLGQPPEFARRITWSHHDDPLKQWVTAQRKRHQPTRHEYWRRVRSYPYSADLQTALLPTIRHFK